MKGIVEFKEDSKFYVFHETKKIEVVKLVDGGNYVSVTGLEIGTEITYSVVSVLGTYCPPDSWEIDDWIEQGLIFEVAVINPEVILEVEKPKRLITNLSFWEEFKKVFLWKI